MALFLLLIVGLWFAFGDPGGDVAGWFWPESAAPWEQVDAFYYPDRNDLSVHREFRDVGSVEACRAWVYSMAAANGDPDLVKGDYECGINPLERGEMLVHRLTVD